MPRKRGRAVSPYQRWIQHQPCLICSAAGKDQQTFTHAHHEPSRGAAGKDHDGLLPLCLAHHTERHNDGRGPAWFYGSRNLDPVALVKQYQEKWRAEGCPVPF